MGRLRNYLVVFLVCAISNSLLGQQQPLPEQQPQVVINFLGEVNVASVGQLIQTVNGQIRNGVKNITLVISSSGGDAFSGFTAYNYLRGVPVELTTFNIGNVDSAATLIYCAGRHRYALKDTRFLIHGSSAVFGSPIALNAEGLENQLAIVKSLNHAIIKVMSDTTKKKEAELNDILKGQLILDSTEAQKWGLVQDIKSEFVPLGAALISVSSPPEPPRNLPPSTPLPPSVASQQ